MNNSEKSSIASDLEPPSSSNNISSYYTLITHIHANSKIERFEVDLEELKRFPFFNSLNEFMENFFNANGLESSSISYVIWGGVAANIMLNLIGRCNIHYSLHDIELFLLKDGIIYQPENLINDLSKNFSANENFLLDIGGRSIIKNLEDVSIEDFQKQRIYRKDGDLCLNNVILVIDRIQGKIFVESPSGTFLDLLAGKNTLIMKEGSDLQSIDRIARRIYRNISKSIRFQQVANLILTSESEKQLEELINSYSVKLENYFLGLITSPQERTLMEEWITDVNITSVESGKKWLFIKTLSETAKRLAGLQGLSSTNQDGYCRFLIGNDVNTTSLFDHPLIQLVRNVLSDSTWPSEGQLRMDIANQCYLDFPIYQKPGAEKLCEIYSKI